VWGSTHWTQTQFDPRDGHTLAEKSDTGKWTVLDPARYAEYMDSLVTSLYKEIALSAAVQDAATNLIVDVPKPAWKEKEWIHHFHLQDTFIAALRKQKSFYKLKYKSYARQSKSHHRPR